MTAQRRKIWIDQYFEALTQATGAARVLGLNDEAHALHRMSVDAMNADIKPKPKPNRNKSR